MSEQWFSDEQLEAAAEAVARLRFIPGAPLAEPMVGNFEREVARAALIAAAPQWRPIETAPMDGTLVLLGSYPGLRHKGWAQEGFYEEKRGWYMANTHWTDAHDGSISPTHWMPLPTPPAPHPEERGV